MFGQAMGSIGGIAADLLMQQQYFNQMNQLGLGALQQAQMPVQPVHPTNPDDKLLVLLTEE